MHSCVCTHLHIPNCANAPAVLDKSEKRKKSCQFSKKTHSGTRMAHKSTHKEERGENPREKTKHQECKPVRAARKEATQKSRLMERPETR